MIDAAHCSSKIVYRVFLASIATFVFTTSIAAAQSPPPLDRVTVPDVNKLGLLDCTGAGLVNGNCGGQYPGFPITKQGKQDKLIALGKAFFWEMQIGSDGVQACASCHFHAGADNRTRNQMNPGLNRVAGTQAAIRNAINPSTLLPNPDTTFTAGTTLTSAHFPLAFDPSFAARPNFGNNNSVGSQGVHRGTFGSLSGGRVEFREGVEQNASLGQDPNGFNLDGTHTVRRVTGRNSPSAVGAVFNLRNFLDGRANLFFNGVNPFGMLTPEAQVDLANGTKTRLMIPFSSLASQAVGPPLSDFEMSLTNRTFRDIANKVLQPLPAGTTPGFIPLDRQAVSTSDSVLQSYTTGVGLNVSYIEFIQDIFQEKFWNDGTPSHITMKNNFALFFGLAVQAYEATLVPDRTPVDNILRTLNGAEPNAASANNIERGLAVFLSGRSGCSGCHFGSETTSASVSHLTGFGNPVPELVVAGVPVPPVALAERMVMGDGTKAIYDTGFYNIGVRPTADDLSLFNRHNNVPFSFGMLAQEILKRNQAVAGVNNLMLTPGALQLPATSTNLTPLPFSITVGCAPGSRGQALGVVNGVGCRSFSANEYIAIRGAFKTPGLRNIKFTGPYMHDGSLKTIREVIDFYNVGGHFNLTFNPDNCRNKTTNCRIGQVDFDPDVEAGTIRQEEIADVVNFLTDGLTDDRVAKEQAPFDHPQICVPNGHNADGSTILVDIPAVGAQGHLTDILTFEETLTGIGSNERHAMNTPCGMNFN